MYKRKRGYRGWNRWNRWIQWILIGLIISIVIGSSGAGWLWLLLPFLFLRYGCGWSYCRFESDYDEVSKPKNDDIDYV